MIGLGTIINVAAIVAGGLIGIVGGKWLTERCQETLIRSMGVRVEALARVASMSVADGIRFC